MGVLDKVAKAASQMGAKMASAPTSEAAGIKARDENVRAYMDAVGHKPEAPAAPASVNSDKDKINKGARYGDRPGEERIDTSEMTKPLGSYKKGTTKVPKTGNYKLHKGEAVIPAHENPMSGMYDKVPGMPAQKAPKVLDHIRVRKAKSGGHIVEHHYDHPDHKMEEHVLGSMSDLHDHMEDHLGTPNVGEAELVPDTDQDQE